MHIAPRHFPQYDGFEVLIAAAGVLFVVALAFIF
jgi:hypothetical protein